MNEEKVKENVAKEVEVAVGEARYISAEETVKDLRKVYSYYRIEEGRDDFVRQGAEFAHPQCAVSNTMDQMEMFALSGGLHRDLETAREIRNSNTEFWKEEWARLNEDHPEWEEFGYWEEYFDVPGCVEEPDAPKVHVIVRRLRDTLKKGPYPTVFVIPSGGLVYNDPYICSNAPVSKYLGCQIVTAEYRSNVDAPYPAAINDLHAAYQWMVDNAEKLQIDLDCIVIYGGSSGGQMSAALPFRLKRYNWCGAPMPRGVVVDDGMFDDFETTRSMRVLSKTWCGLTNRAANMLYMGDNFASGFVGPEAYANHATVEECRGLPPYLIYEGQDNVGADPGMQFSMKLNEAGVQCTFLMWGGSTHSRPAREDNALILPFLNLNIQPEYTPRFGCDGAAIVENYIIGGVKDMLEYDMRRLPREL